ncbi:hypothetical protein J2847_003296 [Azospirillum agricola]|uniref:hypothetical protein n=1 Tax=Azospirillum agricola TaxID=1720247 RepID=UPI001AE1482A|nr:hypothetical protein [Azospirillum agricola]MBP2229993.1 hypothetical protein [Azospirillum agricola]
MEAHTQRYEARRHAGDDAWSVIDQRTGGCAVVGALCFDGLSRDQAQRFAETLNQSGRFFDDREG